MENNNSVLNFKPVDSNFVEKQLNKMNTKKATGHDQISVKMLKIASNVICKPLTTLVNRSIQSNTFPNSMKVADVVPVHKKNSTLEKGNYRPVSLLPITSKLFERAIYTQLIEHFDSIFNPLLSAFRPGYGCNSTLLKIVEDWKLSLDNNKYTAAILMDLSKAFDCLPHDLLLLKMKHYGLSDDALSLVKSYLSDRRQCVKLGNKYSAFKEILKGVPQGSILGPVFFNIFINDIFDFIQKGDLYNYADDNTLSYSSKSPSELVKTLEEGSEILINWFSINHMKANPEKFQAISLGKKTHDLNLNFKFRNVEIKCDKEVKLLGVTIDFLLNFNSHITNICKKASRQLNVMKRIGSNLCKLGRLTMYHSFIMSNFNYCPLTWNFTGEQNIKKIEKIQERALRFIFNDYSKSYEDLLTLSGLPSLKIRRMRTVAIEVFKIINKQGPTYLHNLIEIRNSSYNFRYSNQAILPRPRTEKYGKNSFRYSAAKMWNSLPDNIRECSSYNQFLSLISNWEGPSCSCSLCQT